MIKNNVICPAIWDHLCINTNGKNRLCCNSHTRNNDNFLENFNEHWYDYRNKLKKQILQNERPVECDNCWKKEDLGIKSLRQNFIEKYKQRNEWENFLTRIKQQSDFPIELDLKLGNYCNLSCRMCSSYSSSKYQTEFKKIYKETGIDYGINDYEKHYVQQNWYDSDEFYNIFTKILDNGIKELKFTGGEPLIVPNVKKLLDYCIKKKISKDIILLIITNVTRIDNDWIQIFNKFGHTGLILSIDGIDNTYEYIRYPTNWRDIYKNLQLLKKTKKENIACDITFTLQIYNMLQTKKIVDLSRELGFGLNAIPLDTPEYLDVRNAPDQLKIDALNLLATIEPINNNEFEFLNTCRAKIAQQPLESNKFYRQMLIDISKLKDPYRNQDFTSTEVYKYYG
jgi:MoaA/NifB/PqqE/SkfB family radical SAM enzyme